MNAILPEGSWNQIKHQTHTGQQAEWNKTAHTADPDDIANASYYGRAAAQGQHIKRSNSVYAAQAWKQVLDGTVPVPASTVPTGPARAQPQQQQQAPRRMRNRHGSTFTNNVYAKLNHFLEQIGLPHLQPRFAKLKMTFDDAWRAIDLEGQQLFLTHEERLEMLKTFKYYDELHGHQFDDAPLYDPRQPGVVQSSKGRGGRDRT